MSVSWLGYHLYQDIKAQGAKELFSLIPKMSVCAEEGVFSTIWYR